jgi:cell division protein FtsN
MVGGEDLMNLRRACVCLVSVALFAVVSGCSHEQRDWHAAQAADTIEAYDQFVKAHPASALSTSARSRIVQLTEDRDWQRASTTDTADAYRQFVAEHAQSKYSQEARIRIENFGLNGAAAAAPPSAAAEAAGPPQPAAAPAAAPRPRAPHAEPPAEAGTGQGYGIQLGAYSSQVQALKQWQRLSSRYKSELGGAVSNVERGKSKSGHHIYRLRATVANEARARSICAALKKHGQACVVVRPSKR